MDEINTLQNKPNWRLALSYFGHLLIGIIPLNVVIKILLIYGNDIYKLTVILAYLVILPLWMKALVTTAANLLMKRYIIPNRNQIIAVTVIYFVLVWLILSGGNLFAGMVGIISIFTELWLLAWLIFYSQKFLRNS